MSESQSMPSINEQLTALQRKSFQGLLAAAIMKVLVVFMCASMGQPAFIAFRQVQPLGHKPDHEAEAQAEAQLELAKAAHQRALAAYHMESLVRAIMVVVFLGLAVWARYEPFSPAVIGLGIQVAITIWELVTMNLTILVIIYLAFSVVILLFLIHSVRAGWRHRSLRATA